jgi:hypothetical protein
MDNCVEKGREALTQFKETGTLQIPDDLESNDFGVWMCIFEQEPELTGWTLIALEEQRRLAKSASEAAVESSTVSETAKASGLSISAILAVTCIKNFSLQALSGGTFPSKERHQKWKDLFKEIQPQVINIWLDAFKAFPEFESIMASKELKFPATFTGWKNE